MRVFFFTLFALITNTVIGQTNLAVLFSSQGFEYGKASAIDSQNNYINGSLFQNTINVDPNGTINLTAPGMGTQMALTKYGPSGDLIWGKHMGGSTTSESPHGIGIDADDNIYVAGYFGSTATSGPLNADFDSNGGGTITSQGGEDIFVAKYDKDGNYQWAFGLGNNGQDTQERAWDLATDSSGNSYVVGGFHGTMNFNPLGNTMNYSIPDNTAGIFIAKYNTNGIAQWVIVLDVKGNSVFAETYATCDIDANGNLYVAGNFRGSSVNFNPLGNPNTTLSSNGMNDIFISSYSVSDGNLNWVKQIGSAAQDLVAPGALRCDNNGRPYFTGRLSGNNSVDFDPGNGVTAINNSSLFLTSFDINGDFRFAKGMNSGIGDGGHRVEFDSDNNVYLAGWMNDSANFGGTVLNANSSTADNFMVKYNNDLSICYWGLNFGGNNSSGNSIVAGLSVDHNNNPIITGQLYGTDADINPLGTSQIMSSQGLNDCFIIKYNSNGILWDSSSLNLEDFKLDDEISIYPNPVKKSLFISFPEVESISVEIYDITGRLLLSEKDQKEMYFTNFPSGLYLVKIETSKGVLLRKVVKN